MGKNLSWNIHDAALLLEVYLHIDKDPTTKVAQLSKLSDFYRKRAVKLGIPIDNEYRNLATLSFQYNKLRYLMSEGKYGYPGPVPPILVEIVKLYNSSRDQYEAIIAEEHSIAEDEDCAQTKEVEVHDIQKEINSIRGKFLNLPEYLYNLPIQCLKLSEKLNQCLYKSNIYSINDLVADLSNVLKTSLWENFGHELLRCLNLFIAKYSTSKVLENKIGEQNGNLSRSSAAYINRNRNINEVAPEAHAIAPYSTDKKLDSTKNTSSVSKAHLKLRDKDSDYGGKDGNDKIKSVACSEFEKNMLSVRNKNYYLEDSVMLLPLSSHLANVLLRNRISTIGQFLHLSEEQLSGLYGVGQKTLSEAIGFQKALSNVQGRNPISEKSIVPQEANHNFQKDESILLEKEILPFRNKLDKLTEAKLVARCQLEDKIDVLPLSVRLANILHRNEIHTIHQFISIPPQQLLQMQNMGGKTLAEAVYFQKLITEDTDSFIEKREKNSKVFQKLVDELEKNPAFITKPINEFPIPDSLKHVLIINNIQNVCGLLKQPLSFWSNARDCNAQIISTIITLQKACIYAMSENSPLKKALIKFMGNSLGNRCFDMVPLYLDEESQIIYIWKNELFLSYMKEYVMQFIEANEGVSGGKIGESIPEILYRKKYLGRILVKLVDEKVINLKDGRLYMIYPSIMDYVESITDKKYQRALYLKLKGYTLESIGNELGVTRERVRQILVKTLDKRPKLEDDRYLFLWEKYSFLRDEDFETIFGCSPEQLNYFHLVSKSHSKMGNMRSKSEEKKSRTEGLQEMLLDFSDDIEIRNKIRTLMKKSGTYFLIHGKKVQRNRPGLIRYVVQEYCQNNMTFNDFLNIYNNVLKEIGLDNDKNYTLNHRASINHLANVDYVLWSRGKQFRYYDVNNIDVDVFLDAINIFENENIEISARKIYRSCPDVMKEYDIKDEYELHNLLKKIWETNRINQSLDTRHKLTFGRMPVLRFGEGNREKQVTSLLRDTAPIDRMELAYKYEELYGVHSDSAAANYFACIEQYRVGSTYSIQWKKLPEEEVQVMKSQLTDDFYFVDDIRQKLLENFPDEKAWNINGHTLRQLGFLPYDGYVVSNRYNSAVDYFRKLLRQDVADLRDKRYFYNISTFYAQLTKEKEAFEIVEVKPSIYYSRQYLEKLGIHVKDFPKFGRDVNDFIEDGAFFTVYSLKHSGFVLPWESLNLSDWFYSSILQEDKTDFVGRRYGTHRLFNKSSKPFSLADFISYVTDKMGGYMEFHELIRKIQTDYGFCPQKDKIKQVIQENIDLSEKVEVY